MRDLYEAGIRIPPKTVPLSFQRLEENVAISSFLPPPPSERKKTVDETCGKGGGGNREARVVRRTRCTRGCGEVCAE